MKKLLFLLSVVFLSGCMTVKSYTVEKPRIDTDITGNQGYLSGTPTEAAVTGKLGDTRKISVLEVEFRKPKPRGFLGKYSIKKKKSKSKKVSEIVEENIAGEQVFVEELIQDSQIQYYVVNDNDTLQKISHKFYGTTRKWKFIYDNNKDILKSPDKVYPGTRIKIPAE